MKQTINTLLQAPVIKAATPAKPINENAEKASSNDFKAFLKSQMQAKNSLAAAAKQTESGALNKANANRASHSDVKGQKLNAEKNLSKEAQAHVNDRQGQGADEASLDSALSAENTINQIQSVAFGVEAIQVDENQLDTAQLTEVTTSVMPDEATKLNGFLQTPILMSPQLVSPQVDALKVDALKLEMSQAGLVKAFDASAGLSGRANAPAVDVSAQIDLTLYAPTEAPIHLETKGRTLSPGAFLQAMREVDIQTSQMEKAILQSTNPLQGMPVMDASAKAFAMSPTTMSAIQTPFGQTGWHQEVQQKVVWMATGGLEAATLNLNPPELGPLKVVIQVHNQKADALFISDNADVRLALKDSMEQLREAMRGSAITLGETDVNASGQQHFQEHAEKQAQFNAISERAAKVDVNLTVTEPQTQAKVRDHDGLVNTFA